MDALGQAMAPLCQQLHWNKKATPLGPSLGQGEGVWIEQTDKGVKLMGEGRG